MLAEGAAARETDGRNYGVEWICSSQRWRLRVRGSYGSMRIGGNCGEVLDDFLGALGLTGAGFATGMA